MRVLPLLAVLSLLAAPAGAEEKTPESLVAEMAAADTKTVAAIREKLIGLGPKALPALLDAVDAEKSRQRALPALRALGAYCGPYVERIVPLLDVSDMPTQYAAAVALFEAGPEAAVAAPRLRRLLTSDAAMLRGVVASGLLATRQAKADLLLPVLKELSESQSLGDSHVQPVSGIITLAREDAHALAHVVEALEERKPHHVMAYLIYAGDLGHMAGPAVPALRAYLKDRLPMLRMLAAESLLRLRLDPAAAAVVARGMESANTAEQLEAMATASALPQVASVTVPRLLELAKLPTLAPGAWQTLAAIASAKEARAAVPAAIAALEQPGVEALAARFLSRVGEAARPARKRLEKVLESQSAPARLAAAAALLGLGGAHAEALRTLSSGFEIDTDPESVVGYELLKPAARKSEGVVGIIAKGAKDKRAKVRGAAAHALAEVGPAAHTAVPALVRLLEDPIPEVRHQAARALGRILVDGPREDSAREALRVGLANEAWIVRAWCGVVLLRAPEARLESEAAKSALEWAARHRRAWHHYDAGEDRGVEPIDDLIAPAKAALARLKK